jgi:hypothetical protein
MGGSTSILAKVVWIDYSDRVVVCRWRMLMSYLTEPVTVSRWVILVLIVVVVASLVPHLLPLIRSALKKSAPRKKRNDEESEESRIEPQPEHESEEQAVPAPADDGEPFWEVYTEDTFFSLRWKWTYTDKKEPQDIDVFCPRCDTPLTEKADQYWVDFACGPCGNDLKRIRGNWKSICATVKKDIQRKISSGEWKTVKRRKS